VRRGRRSSSSRSSSRRSSATCRSSWAPRSRPARARHADLRGFYFTSGTQEGRPMDRVLERMSAAMGIRATAQNRPASMQAQQQPAVQPQHRVEELLPLQPVHEHHLPGRRASASSASDRGASAACCMKVAIAGATIGARSAPRAARGHRSYANNKDVPRPSRACTQSKASAKLDWTSDEGDAAEARCSDARQARRSAEGAGRVRRRGRAPHHEVVDVRRRQGVAARSLKVYASA
jgi:type VI protein secretion system component VasK